MFWQDFYLSLHFLIGKQLLFINYFLFLFWEASERHKVFYLLLEMKSIEVF